MELTKVSNTVIADSVFSTGEIAQFPMSTLPTGWLQLLGTNVSRTTYAALFSKIGTLYGEGDGTTTFTLPTLLSFLALFGVGTPLIGPKSQHAASILSDGRILVIGGHDGIVARAETYFGTITGNTITWVSGTSLPAIKYRHAASILSDGRILVTGGYDGVYVKAETYFGTIARWGIRT